MAHRLNRVYVHLVWSTMNRLPLVSFDMEEQLYPYIMKQCQILKCVPIAIGGMPDHVHLLVRLETTVTISELMHRVKGASVYLIRKKLKSRESCFQWNPGYAAFSVTYDHVQRVIDYIHRQKEHHQGNQVVPGWELA